MMPMETFGALLSIKGHITVELRSMAQINFSNGSGGSSQAVWGPLAVPQARPLGLSRARRPRFHTLR
jgi:hypothetical protein